MICAPSLVITMWTRALVCSVLIGAAMAEAIGGPLQPKPEKYSHLEGCYIEQLDRVIPFDSSAPSDSLCMQYSCSQDAVGYISCDVPYAGPSCTTMKRTIVEDKQKPFPGCCPWIVCSDDYPEVHTNDTALA